MADKRGPSVSITHPRPVSTVRAMGLGRLGGWTVWELHDLKEWVV